MIHYLVDPESFTTMCGESTRKLGVAQLVWNDSDRHLITCTSCMDILYYMEMYEEHGIAR